MFAGALFAGTLISYPLHLFISQFAEADFADIVIRATQLTGLLFSLFYLKYADVLSLQGIGLKPEQGGYLDPAGYGFLGGLVILGLLALGLVLTGIYGFHPDREISVAIITRLVLGAILTGIVVALFEETVFRGALLQGLARQSGPLTALLTTSIIYAAVHFIYFEEPSAGNVSWSTAPLQFFQAYSQFMTAEKIDAFLSLFMLGVLLGLVRLKTGNIIQCIGLHAGLVAGIKLFRFFTLYNPDTQYPYLVSPHDYRLGYMALLLLTVITVIYYFYHYRKDGPTLFQTRR